MGGDVIDQRVCIGGCVCERGGEDDASHCGIGTTK